MVAIVPEPDPCCCLRMDELPGRGDAEDLTAVPLVVVVAGAGPIPSGGGTRGFP